MILRYGPYTHEQDEIIFSESKRDELNQGGLPYKRIVTWSIQGQLIGSSATELATKMNALDAAYSRYFFDAVLTDNSGVELRRMRTGTSVSGVRPTPPSYPADRTAFTTYMPYTVSLTAEYPIGPKGQEGGIDPFQLLSFSETIALSGGGPRYVVIQTANTKPQRQMLFSHTPYRAIQSGSAMGRFGYPPIPKPMFPGAQVAAPNITRNGPRREGFKLEGYAISWSYEFESAEPLVGVPNVWVF